MEEAKNERLEEEGKKILGGVTILFWVVSILTGIGMFSLNFGNWMPKDIFIGPVAIGFPAPSSSWIPLALFVAALVGLYVRKGWAVPVGRAGLVVTMVIFFPVGTIFGGIVWKRYNDPIAKMYLNYKLPKEEKEKALEEFDKKPEEKAKK